MKIVILGHSNVDDWYAATLLERGHEVSIFGGGAINATIMKIFSDYDGCLLIGDTSEHLEFADIFESTGRKVWRQLADIPAKPFGSQL